MFTITVGTPHITQVQRLLDTKAVTVKQAMNEVAQDTANFTSQFIQSHTRRGGSSGKLAREFSKVIKSGSVTKGDYSVGIGDTGNLTKKVPYWYVVNYGKMVSGAEYIPNYGRPVGGKFADGRPEAGGDGGRFKTGGPFAMKAGKAIRPMRYIEAAKRYFKDQWSKRFK